MIRSDNGGESWQAIGRGLDGREFPEAIVADDVVSGRLHAACRSGVFYTSGDAGDSWQRLEMGLKIDDLSSLALAHA